MAANILSPVSLFDIASEIETQAGSLKAGIRLMYDQLQVGHSDSERVADALSKLYFLTDALDDVGTRMEALSAAAYAMHSTSKPAAPSFLNRENRETGETA